MLRSSFRWLRRASHLGLHLERVLSRENTLPILRESRDSTLGCVVAVCWHEIERNRETRRETSEKENTVEQNLDCDTHARVTSPTWPRLLSCLWEWCGGLFCFRRPLPSSGWPRRMRVSYWLKVLAAGFVVVRFSCFWGIGREILTLLFIQVFVQFCFSDSGHCGLAQYNHEIEDTGAWGGRRHSFRRKRRDELFLLCFGVVFCSVFVNHVGLRRRRMGT